MKLNLVSLAFCLSSGSLSMLAGCAADTSSEPNADAELVDQSEDAVTGAPSNFGFYIVTRHDMRRCMSPICGGVFVKRVNQATTRCADGTLQAECYVSAVDLKNVGLSARELEAVGGAGSAVGGKAVLKAAMYKEKFNGGTIGLLRASQLWVSATGAPVDGTFYRAASNGRVCVTAPCPDITASPLNGHGDFDVIDVKFGTTASQESLDRAAEALRTKEGVIVSGGISLPRCVPGSNCGPWLTAQNFFLRATGTEGKGCGGHTVTHTTCNAGQFCKWKTADICGAADASGKCEYKAEICTQDFNPVCGCDGKTYSNECSAAGAGTSVSRMGACAN